MPGATVTPKCLGAATGASTEAACPDCNACRTALGCRCRGAADHTRSGTERRARMTAVTIVAAAQNESSLSQVGNFEGVRARQIGPPSRGATAYGVVGPGVTSPKSRSSGCRAGHAGYESFPSVLPGPTLLRRAPGAGRRCWRSGASAIGSPPAWSCLRPPCDRSRRAPPSGCGGSDRWPPCGWRG
jgi:hypothetical protein